MLVWGISIIDFYVNGFDSPLVVLQKRFYFLHFYQSIYLFGCELAESIFWRLFDLFLWKIEFFTVLGHVLLCNSLFDGRSSGIDVLGVDADEFFISEMILCTHNKFINWRWKINTKWEFRNQWMVFMTLETLWLSTLNSEINLLYFLVRIYNSFLFSWMSGSSI